VCVIAWRAQRRLYRKWQRLHHQRRKPSSVVAVVCARELSAFLWEAAIGHEIPSPSHISLTRTVVRYDLRPCRPDNTERPHLLANSHAGSANLPVDKTPLHVSRGADEAKRETLSSQRCYPRPLGRTSLNTLPVVPTGPVFSVAAT
jgi:hypothetical protein